MLRPPTLRALALFAAALLASAQAQDALKVSPLFLRSASQAEAKYSLQGTLIDAVTGAPIRHALIQVDAPQRHMVFTDAQGRFRFNQLQPMQTRLTVIKPGYAQEGADEGGNATFRVRIGPDAQALTIKMSPRGEIDGTLTDTDGQILDGVPVKLFHFTMQNGVRKKQEYRQSQTDEDGGFQFYNLPAGEYTLSAGPSWKDLGDPFQPGTEPVFAYPQAYFPGVADISAAGTIHLDGSKHERADFSLSTAKTFAVSGVTVGGPPGTHSVVFMNSAGQPIALIERNDVRNGFHARVTAGPALVKASGFDREGKSYYGEVQLDVGSDLNDVRINMEQIDIQIVVRRQNPSDGSTQQPSFEYPPQLRLISLDPVHPDTSSVNEGESGNVHATVRAIEYGRYRVEVDAGSWTVESITSGGTDLKSQPLIVSQGGVQPIEISLGRAK